MAFPKIDGYVVTEKLGSGSYSTVYKAYTKVGARTIVAIKCIDKCRVKNSGSAVDNLVTEIRLLKTLQHPHIVRMHHFTWDDRNIYIIMEYCCGGDLSKYIHRYGRVPEKQVLYFLQQLASALKFLSEKGVVHMDLKPHNLLLHKESGGKYILKVADFGFAQHLSVCSGPGAGSGVRGSPLYMAPEMIAGDYDARVDLWSVGVIMYECLFGKAPYSSNTFQQLVDKIQKQAPIEIPRNCSISAECCDLLTRLLQHDPDTRISYQEFFNHDYLDLDHMPSKENYEKAVSLIKQAIELDSAGRAGEALRCYTRSLRYLVPAARAEGDALRRSALTAKLIRYMERAEEIKEYLKYSKTEPTTRSDMTADTTADTTRRRHDMAACCGDTARDNTNSYDFSNTGPRCNLCKCTSPQTNSSTDTCSCTSDREPDTSRERQVLSDPAAEPQPSPAGPHAHAHAQPHAHGQPRGSRFGFRRLFSRQPAHALPYLHNNDSSIADDTPQSDKTQKVGETNDACRIT